jgi:hypothetical protein
MIRIEQCCVGGAGAGKKRPNWRQQQGWGERGGGRANIKDQNAKIQGKNQNVGKRENCENAGEKAGPVSSTG